MEKRSRSRGSVKDIGRGSESRRSTSNRHSGGRRSRERWEKSGDRSPGEKRRGKTASRVEQFSFTEDQWKQVERGPERGRRSKTAERERLGGWTSAMGRSVTAGRVNLEDRSGGELGTVGRSRTGGRLPTDERLGGGTSREERSRTAGRVPLEERLRDGASIVRRSKTREDSSRGRGLDDLFGKVEAVGRELRDCTSGRGDLRDRLSGVNQARPLSRGPCRYFKQGRCTWGGGCNFKHEVERSPGAIQPQSRKKHPPKIQYFEYSSKPRGTHQRKESNVCSSSKRKSKDGENNEDDIEDGTERVKESNKYISCKKMKLAAEVERLEEAVTLHIEMGKEGTKDKESVEKAKKEESARLNDEVQKLEEKITLQRGNKKPREETDKARLIDVVQRLEEAVRRKQKQTAFRSQTSPRKKQMKHRGRRVVMKAGEEDGEANMGTAGRVAERKAMPPITRFLEGEHVRSPSNFSGILDKSPKSNAGAAHPDKSPGAVSSQSVTVTSEENPVQDLENCWNLLNREAKEVEQRWSLNDTLEMCVSEREREDLSGLTNWEGSTGTVFGDLKGKGLIKKSLRENEFPRNQLLKKLPVTSLIL